MVGASCQGMPMSQATGAPKTPRMALSECGKGMWPCAQAKLEMPSMMALRRPTSARKLMSMMATLKASCAAVDGAAGDGADEVFVGVLFAGRHVDGAGGGGDFGFGDEHLGDEDGAGRGHDDGGEQVLGVDAEERCRRP